MAPRAPTADEIDRQLAYEQQQMALAQQRANGGIGYTVGKIGGAAGTAKLASMLGGGSAAAGTAAGTTAATGATAAAPVAAEAGAGSAGIGSSLAGVGPYAGAALLASYLLTKGIAAGRDQSVGDAIKKTAKQKTTWLLGGLPILASGITAALGAGNRTRVEDTRLDALRKAGFDIPRRTKSEVNYTQDEMLADIAKANLPDDFVGEKDGVFYNVPWAKTNDEKYLKPRDIQGYAAIIDKAGPEATLQDRLALAQKALDAGAVNEHHGTIDVDWAKVDSQPLDKTEQKKDKIKSLIAEQLV